MVDIQCNVVMPSLVGLQCDVYISMCDAQVWGHEACVADLATASVDVVLVMLLVALAVGLCRPRAAAAASGAQPRQPTLSERALLLELTATLLLLVAWIRLVYAANDHGWRQLTPGRCNSFLDSPPAARCKRYFAIPSRESTIAIHYL